MSEKIKILGAMVNPDEVISIEKYRPTFSKILGPILIVSYISTVVWASFKVLSVPSISIADEVQFVGIATVVGICAVVVGIIFILFYFLSKAFLGLGKGRVLVGLKSGQIIRGNLVGYDSLDKIIELLTKRVEGKTPSKGFFVFCGHTIEKQNVTYVGSHATEWSIVSAGISGIFGFLSFLVAVSAAFELVKAFGVVFGIVRSSDFFVTLFGAIMLFLISAGFLYLGKYLGKNFCYVSVLGFDGEDFFKFSSTYKKDEESNSLAEKVRYSIENLS